MKHYVLKKKLNNQESIELKRQKKKHQKLPLDIDLDISDPMIQEFIEKKGIVLKNYEEL